MVCCIVPIMVLHGYTVCDGKLYGPYYGLAWLYPMLWYAVLSLLWSCMVTPSVMVSCMVPIMVLHGYTLCYGMLSCPYYGPAWLCTVCDSMLYCPGIMVAPSFLCQKIGCWEKNWTLEKRSECKTARYLIPFVVIRSNYLRTCELYIWKEMKVLEVWLLQ